MDDFISHSDASPVKHESAFERKKSRKKSRAVFTGISQYG